MIFLLYVLLLFISWVALILCWQGQQIPSPAACRKCKRATGDSRETLAQTCAGCGADLKKSPAIIYFRRTRSPKFIAGFLVALIAVVALSATPLLESAEIFTELLEREDASIVDFGWLKRDPTAEPTFDDVFGGFRVFAWLAFVGAVLMVLGVAGCPAFAHGFLLFFRGRMAAYLPRCAKCRAPLTRDVLAAGTGCPACGCTPLSTTATRTPAHLSGLLYMLSPVALAMLLGLYMAVGLYILLLQ